VKHNFNVVEHEIKLQTLKYKITILSSTKTLYKFNINIVNVCNIILILVNSKQTKMYGEKKIN
jgi:hypothetical protein